MLLRVTLLLSLLVTACATPAPGPRVSDVVVHELDGRERALTVLQGHPAVVYFLTTGCDLCLADLGKLQHLHSNHSAQGLRMVLVVMDPAGADVARPFAESLQLPFPVVVAGQALRYGQTALGTTERVPRVLVLDRGGRVRFDHSGVVPYETLEQQVRAAIQAAGS